MGAESSLRDRGANWAIGLAKYGSSWWMPFPLLAVCVANTLTGGVFIWCLGIVQAILFPVVVLSNGRLGVLLGPAILTIAAAIGAVTYMQLMKSEGADVLLASTGAKDSKWLATAQHWADNYGMLGLLLMKILPVPIPTAGLVVVASLAKMAEHKIFIIVVGGNFVELFLGAIAMQYAVEERSLEEFLRIQFQGEKQEGL